MIFNYFSVILFLLTREAYFIDLDKKLDLSIRLVPDRYIFSHTRNQQFSKENQPPKPLSLTFGHSDNENSEIPPDNNHFYIYFKVILTFLYKGLFIFLY